MKKTTKKILVAGLSLSMVAAPLTTAVAPSFVSAAEAVTTGKVAAAPVLLTKYIAPVTDNPYVFKARFSVLNTDLTPVKSFSKVELVTLNADGTVEKALPMTYTKLDAARYDAWIDQGFVVNQYGKTFYILVTDGTGKQQLVKSGGEQSTFNYKLENGNKVGIHATPDQLLQLTPVIDIATKFTGMIEDANKKIVKLGFEASYEYGEVMDNIKVTLKSETTGWSIDLDPAFTLWQNPANPTQYHLWFDEQLLTYGQTYSIAITGPNQASELLYMPASAPAVKLASGKTLLAKKGAFDRLYITVS